MRNIFSDFTNDLKSYSDIMTFVKRELAIDWLWPMQKEVLVDYYNPVSTYQDMILVIGMRGGKTTIASVCGAYECYKLVSLGYSNRRYGLPPGSQIFIVNVATSDRQARDTVFTATKARIDNSPWFQKQEYTEHSNEFIFPTSDGEVIIRSEHSNSASLAGKTIIACIFDELSRFKDTKGNSSGEMVYDTLSRSVKSFSKDGRRISISSPMLVDDFHMQLHDVGKDNPKVYTRQMPTWEMNPTITYKSLADEFARNPETAMRDYGAVPSAALETYFKEPWKIDQCERVEMTNAFEVDEEGFSLVLNPDWQPQERTRYVLAGDPAFKNDAFGVALGHHDGKRKYIIDGVGRFLPNTTNQEHEIDAEAVANLCLDVREGCWLTHFVSDTWMFPETQQRIRRTGIEVINNIVKKDEFL